METQRNISWGEISLLESIFNLQCQLLGIEFECEESRNEATIDYVSQFVDGIDFPTIKH